MKNLCLFLMVCIILSCNDTRPIVIRPFEVINSIDTIKNGKKLIISKEDNFLIEFYKNNRRYNNYIDSFLRKNKAKDWSMYNDYVMVLYKKSDRTNFTGSKYLTVDLHKKYTNYNDLLYQYVWSKDGSLRIDTFKNGQVVYKPNPRVKISDVKK